jgi:(2Fe-2S) ferredoxin
MQMQNSGSEKKTVIVCVNRRSNPARPSCGVGGEQLAHALQNAIAQQGLPVCVETFYCLGECEQGPNLKLSPGGEFMHRVHLEDLPGILNKIAVFAKG